MRSRSCARKTHSSDCCDTTFDIRRECKDGECVFTKRQKPFPSHVSYLVVSHVQFIMSRKERQSFFGEKRLQGGLFRPVITWYSLPVLPYCRFPLPQMSRSQGLFCEDKFLLYKINPGTNLAGRIQVFLLKNSITCFPSVCQKLCAVSHPTAFSTSSVTSVPSAVMTVCFSRPLWKSMCSASAMAFFR